MNATARHVLAHVYPAAASLLPASMSSPQAWRMLTAIGLQESGFQHRVQVRGPAVGFWQFERGGGVTGVLTHPQTRQIAADICDVLCYDATPSAVYSALADNDVLAACFARLLLWTDPRPLPNVHDAADGWAQYLATWRPGKPHAHTWNGHFAAAWAVYLPTVRA